MKVDVEDLLTGRFSVGQQQVDAVAAQPGPPQRAGQPLRHGPHVRPGVRREIAEPRRVPTRHDEQVPGRHRAQVHERDSRVVRVHDAGLGPPGRDLAEHARSHGLRC
ncbi:hypothetical protein GCM10017581_040430 [Dactylosporangium matsuzakiense]|uniref:Uncharacterized protein n=1 Tax=Dactylosporangium matsuzakiense TaxID=53360 RepID=A0A9W6KL57_9ACTN|nr:hypothetical protein [Dactylosporangium matsuzakiense]GLL02301.1 hypothetical protein GCM10017581_040430 [Dactylosporangium matsuzakiense]